MGTSPQPVPPRAKAITGILETASLQRRHDDVTEDSRAERGEGTATVLQHSDPVWPVP